MATGTIKRLMGDRGYGFIGLDGDNAADEVFFHHSALDDSSFDTLQEGQRVEFEQQPDPRNPDRTRAAHVRLIDEEPTS